MVKKYYEKVRGWFHENHIPDIDYEIRTAKIDDPYYGLGDYGRASLGLHMQLHSDNGNSTFIVNDINI